MGKNEEAIQPCPHHGESSFRASALSHAVLYSQPLTDGGEMEKEQELSLCKGPGKKSQQIQLLNDKTCTYKTVDLSPAGRPLQACSWFGVQPHGLFGQKGITDYSQCVQINAQCLLVQAKLHVHSAPFSQICGETLQTFGEWNCPV